MGSLLGAAFFRSKIGLQALFDAKFRPFPLLFQAVGSVRSQGKTGFGALYQWLGFFSLV
jgi:hypothetical protein